MWGAVRELLDLLSARERWKLGQLLGGMIVLGIIEMVGVGSIMPFMAVVGDPSIIADNEWLRAVNARLEFANTRSMLMFLGVVSLAMLAIRNASSAMMNWAMLRFTWNINHRLSHRLLDRYLQMPYAFYLGNNSAALGMNVLSEVNRVVTGILAPMLKIITATVVASAILALLIYADPILALFAMCVFGSAYGIIYLIVHRRLKSIGLQRRVADRGRYQAANEALGGIKEVKAAAREKEFSARYANHSRTLSSHMEAYGTIGTLPRYLLETIAFGCIILIVLYLLRTRGHLGEALSVMGLFAFAAYRLVPDIQQIFQGYTSLSFYLPSLHALHADVITNAPAGERSVAGMRGLTHLEARQEIRLVSITFRYPGSEEAVLNDVEILIPINNTVALVGPTGSGKTTLVDILLGLLEPESGALLVDGRRIGLEDMDSWRAVVGYVPQEIYLCDDTIRRNIAFGFSEGDINDDVIEQVSRIAQIHDFVTAMDRGYETIVGERGVRLSGGERQRIGIARALYRNPAILILDEATSALDTVTEAEVMNGIRSLALQKTIILIAHRLSTVKGADLVYMIEDGRVAASGSYADVEEGSARFRKMSRLGLAGTGTDGGRSVV